MNLTGVVTVTPAPAIDWTVTVDSWQLGAVNVITDSVREASGKGVNVAWALHRAGVPVRALLPAGGATATFVADELTRGGLPHTIVAIERDVRTNITLITPGDSTKINEPGAAIDPAEFDRVTDSLVENVRGADIVAFCGSLPAGLPTDAYATLIRAARTAEPGLRVVLDSSGAPLAEALAAEPDLIKPNVHELAELTGRELTTLGEVRDAAQAARDLGAGGVLASLGADGSMLVTGDATLIARSHDVPFVNSVGAGDALLAGFIAGGGIGEQALATASLWAASAVACPTTLFPVLHELEDRIQVSELTEPGLRLTEPATPTPAH
ncbi:1-phosphofructokinase family hexose kinase [Enemella sp. A6]|uniref:1-phosphofructokinase family hexose kinase n=1 Tax=Enemella sp. A6 TaxID=3440152 RepID=UPI003EC023DB